MRIRQPQSRPGSPHSGTESAGAESNWWDLGLLGTVMLALSIYVGSYFLVVRPGASIWFAPSGRKLVMLPSYHGLPPQVFSPIHFVDRTILRPNLWNPARVWVVRGQKGVIAVGTSRTNLTWKMTRGGAVPYWAAPDPANP